MSSVQAANSVTVQVTRALSRANNIIVKTRLDPKLRNPTQDSLASQPWTYDVLPAATTTADVVAAEQGDNGTLRGFQVQLGAQFIPSQPIQHREDFLHSALKTFSQFRRSDELDGVQLPTFTGVKTVQGTNAPLDSVYKPGLAIAAIPLESSSTLQQSGAAISAQRTAVVNLEWGDEAPRFNTMNANRRIDLFVTYSKLATLFLDSVVVRS